MALAGREIAVIGAGIGGLAAALALARRGAAVTVLEQASELGEVGAGLQLGPNAVGVLTALGLCEPAAAVAIRPEAIELRDGVRGRLVARLPLGATAEARWGRPYWHMHRADLLALLADAAGAAGVRIALGTRVLRVATAGAEVRIATEAGEALASAAIGADGLRSRLRAAHVQGHAPRYAGHVAWRALVPAERLPAGLFPRAATVMMGPGRHIVVYPLRGGRLVNLVAVERRARWAAEGWRHPDDPANLRRAFAGWEPRVGALLDAVDATWAWGLFDHPPLAAWVSGRLALLGDACHPVLPFLAQGAAMALEDAWVLADALDRAESVPTGLGAYEARRRARVERVGRASARNGRLFHLAHPRLRRLAHAGIGLGTRLAPGAALARFDWLYAEDVTLDFA